MKTLLFLSDIPWHSLYQRPQHIASRLARTEPVLWIEPATLSSKVFFKPQKVQERLHILSLPLFPHNARQKVVRVLTHLLSRIPFLRWCVLRWQLVLIKRAIAELQADPTELSCLIENFQFITLAERLNPRRMVFDYIDDAFGFVEFPSYVREEWKRAIHRADAITATTEELAQLIRNERAIDVHIVCNGVDYEFFSTPLQVPRPADLPQTGLPIVGYVGSIAAWFDLDLLEECVKKFPSVNFVIIGREHPIVAERLDVLKKYENFCFLGYKPYTDLPPYVQHFDAGIIPFKKNKLTAAVNPVKLYEYCAAGIPTISTDFAKGMEQFKDIIFLASSPEQFVQHLETALKKSHDDRFRAVLRDFGRKNSWDSRGQQIRSILDEVR